MQHHILTGSLALALGLGAAQAGASTVELPLTGLRSGAFIQDYFNGGADSVPTDGTGPQLGFTFSSNAEALSAASGGGGKVEHDPTPSLGDVLYFSGSNTTAAYMNYAAGFTGLSFDYSYSNNAGANALASFYSGVNGTGTLLGTISLAPATSNIQACSSRQNAYCTWQAAAGGLAGSTAESVVFSGLAAGSTTGSPTTITEFTGLTVTPAAPVPLPAAAWFLLSGAAGLAGFARRRKVTAA